MRVVHSLMPLFAFLAASVLSSQGQILLTVDESNYNAVTITATGTAPSTAVAGTNVFDGINLLGFFTSDAANIGAAHVAADTLTTGNASTGPVLTYVSSDDISSGNPSDSIDLGLYGYEQTSAGSGVFLPETFSLNSPAFLGSVTIDFANSGLSLSGNNGIVDEGAAFSGSTQIGRYQVVGAPEPSAFLLILGGLALFYSTSCRRLRLDVRENRLSNNSDWTAAKTVGAVLSR
jgi:hypothetical protein